MNTYKARCVCGRTFHHREAHTVKQWIEAHQRLHCKHDSPVIDFWEGLYTTVTP